MPLTLEQKKQLISAHGLDPSAYQVTETQDGGAEIAPLQQEQPTGNVGWGNFTTTAQEEQTKVQPSTPPIDPTAPSALTSFTREVARSAPAAAVGAGTLATYGGLLSGLGVGADATGIGLPAGLALGGVGLGLSGLAAYLTRKAQNKYLVPNLPASTAQEYQQHEAADQATNPYSTLAGGIAANYFGGMSPGLSLNGAGPVSAVRSLARIPANIGTSSALTAAERANLLNVGLGATLPVAQGLATHAATGEPIDPKAMALEALGGAIMSKPNALGKKFFGFHQLPENLGDRYQEIGNKDNSKNGLPTQDQLYAPPATTAEEAPVATVDSRGQPIYRTYPQTKDATSILEAPEKLPTAKVAPVPTERQAASTKDVVLSVDLNDATTPLKKLGYTDADIATLSKPQMDGIIANEIPREDHPNFREQGPEVAPTQGEQELSSKLPPTPDKLPDQNKNTGKVGNWVYNWFSKLGVKMGARLSPEGTLIDNNGKPLVGSRGMVEARKGLEDVIARVNVYKATPDTIPHEAVIHPLLEMLENSPKGADQRLVKRMYNAVAEQPDFQAYKAKRIAAGNDRPDVPYYHENEYITEHSGKELVRMVDANDANLNKDLVAAYKVRFGKPTMADITRFVSTRAIHGEGFNELFKGTKGIPYAGQADRELEDRLKGDVQEANDAYRGVGSPTQRMQDAPDLTSGSRGGKDMMDALEEANTKSLASLNPVQIARMNDTAKHAWEIVDKYRKSNDPRLFRIESLVSKAEKEPNVNLLRQYMNDIIDIDGRSYRAQGPQDEELSSLYNKVNSGQELTPAEKARYEELGNEDMHQGFKGKDDSVVKVPIHESYIPKGELARNQGPEEEATVKPLAPAIYHGKQDFGDLGSVELYNLTHDIAGHPKGSTVSKETLEQKGYRVPEKDTTPKSEAKMQGPEEAEVGKPILVKDIKSRLPKFSVPNDMSQMSLEELKAAKDKAGRAITDDSDTSKHWLEMFGKYQREFNRRLDYINNPKFQGPEETGASTTPTKKEETYLGPLTSRIDKIAATLKTPTAREVTGELRKLGTHADRLKGILSDKLNSAMDGYSKEEIARVMEQRHAISIGEETPYTLSDHEQTLKDKWDEAWKIPLREAQKEGMQVKNVEGNFFRDAQEKPEGYQPSMFSEKVREAIKGDTKEAAEYEQQYKDYAISKGFTEKEAQEAWNIRRASMGNAGTTPSTKFGALRKVEGIGLPWSLSEHNAPTLIRRYTQRAANDIAYHKYVEANPRMLKALEGSGSVKNQYGQRFSDLPAIEQKGTEDIKDIGHTDVVKQAMRSVMGIDKHQMPVMNTAIRAVSAGIMQTGTGLRNLLQLGPSIAPYYGVNPHTIMDAVSNMSRRTSEAIRNGAIKGSFLYRDAAGDFSGSSNAFVNHAGKVIDIMRKYTGRNLLDHLESSFAYSLGETLAPRWIAMAKNGDIQARAMLRRFGTTVEGGVEGLWSSKDAPVAKDDVSTIAKEFSDAVVGTYGASGLPSAAIEGPASPFLSLSRWSIERSNLFKKDVIEPLRTQGNWMPLLKVTLAGLMSGAAIEKLNELLSNKKSHDPSVMETLQAGRPDDMAAKAIGLLQLGSYAGILGDLAKFGAATYQGKDLKFDQPMSLPAATLAEDTAQNVSYMMQAIHHGEDPFEVLAKFMEETGKNSLQDVRYVMGNTIEAKENQKKDKMRDMSVFNELTHVPKSDIVGGGNPFDNLEAKEYKKHTDEDPQRIAEELPKVLKDYIARYGSNPELLRSKLQALKSESYDTMPSPDTMPMSFFRYLNYLKQTQGDEAVQTRLIDYMKQNAINKAKGELIPSI